MCLEGSEQADRWGEYQMGSQVGVWGGYPPVGKAWGQLHQHLGVNLPGEEG